MKALFCSAVLAISVVAMPANAAPRNIQPSTYDDPLPPGCFQLFPTGPIICLPMPIE